MFGQNGGHNNDKSTYGQKVGKSSSYYLSSENVVHRFCVFVSMPGFLSPVDMYDASPTTIILDWWSSLYGLSFLPVRAHVV